MEITSAGFSPGTLLISSHPHGLRSDEIGLHLRFAVFKQQLNHFTKIEFNSSTHGFISPRTLLLASVPSGFTSNARTCIFAVSATYRVFHLFF